MIAIINGDNTAYFTRVYKSLYSLQNANVLATVIVTLLLVFFQPLYYLHAEEPGTWGFCLALGTISFLHFYPLVNGVQAPHLPYCLLCPQADMVERRWRLARGRLGEGSQAENEC
jgi:hypothetical protein